MVAVVTIWEERLFCSELLIVRLLFEGSNYLKKSRLIEMEFCVAIKVGLLHLQMYRYATSIDIALFSRKPWEWDYKQMLWYKYYFDPPGHMLQIPKQFN